MDIGHHSKIVLTLFIITKKMCYEHCDNKINPFTVTVLGGEKKIRFLFRS